VTQLLDEFDRVFIINLASRADRRVEMNEQLARIRQPLRAGHIEFFEAVRPDHAGGFPSIGARGCFESHLSVLQTAQSLGLRRVLILEDDLNFAPDFLDEQAYVAAALNQEDWGMFYGGYRIRQALPSDDILAELLAGAWVECSHFVGFQGEAIGQAAQWLAQLAQRQPGDPAGGPMHVDGAYTWLRRTHPEMRTLMAVEQLGYQRASRTDIHELPWYDKVAGVRNVVATLRSWRN